MPAPNLGLVGAMGVGALQHDIQRMEAERRAAEQLAYKRRQDEQAAAELARHRQALEDYQQRNLTVNEMEAQNRMTALNAPKEPAKPTVHSGLASSDPAKKGKFVVGILPDGTRVWEHAQAADEPKPENLTDYATFLTKTPEEQARELALRDKYYRAGDAPPRPFAPFVLATPEGIVQVDRNSQTATPVRDASGNVVQPQDTAEQRNRAASITRAKTILDSIGELSERININQGAVATIKGAAEQAKAKINLSDDVSEYEAVTSGFVPLLARAVGHVGVLTEQDVQSVRRMLPAPTDSKAVRDRKIARINKIMFEMEGGGADTGEAIGGGTLSAPISIGGGGSSGRGAAPPAGGGATSGAPVERWEKDPKTGEIRRVVR